MGGRQSKSSDISFLQRPFVKVRGVSNDIPTTAELAKSRILSPRRYSYEITTRINSQELFKLGFGVFSLNIDTAFMSSVWTFSKSLAMQQQHHPFPLTRRPNAGF